MSSISLKPELSELYPLNEYITNILKKEDLKVNLIVEEVFVNIVNYSNAKHVTVAAVLKIRYWPWSSLMTALNSIH